MSEMRARNIRDVGEEGGKELKDIGMWRCGVGSMGKVEGKNEGRIEGGMIFDQGG